METAEKNLGKSDATGEGKNYDDLASRWTRLGAAFIDGLTIMPITLPLMYFTGGFDGLSEGLQPSLSYTLLMGLTSIAIFLLIHGRFLVRDGQTLGKKFLDIKIVGLSGEHASVQVLAKRYGFYWLIPLIPGVGALLNMVNILFIFGKSRRCLHDHVGGTKVVCS